MPKLKVDWFWFLLILIIKWGLTHLKFNHLFNFQRAFRQKFLQGFPNELEATKLLSMRLSTEVRPPRFGREGRIILAITKVKKKISFLTFFFKLNHQVKNTTDPNSWQRNDTLIKCPLRVMFIF